ncbi:MAG: polysaccharide deacetylase family protein [Candidatus Methanoperedens sp.]|nr:polysaccharide deacetylase family protein [Candidatus Methanoperedens sp.]MCE8427179.1 polysaccharide deacetylase family protein [Candidatus Methanoperedens sp.]
MKNLEIEHIRMQKMKSIASTNRNRPENILVILFLAVLVISTSPALAADKPKVILAFDDGWTSVYYKALPIMQANNQPGTAFIITGEVKGATGAEGMEYMTLAQLKTLYSAGWDLSSHTVTHPDLTTLSMSAMNTELTTSQNWLITSGFPRGARFLAYPYGAYNTNVISAVKTNGYFAARTVEGTASNYPKYKLTDPTVFTMGTLLAAGVPGYGDPATPPSYVKTEINNTIAANGLLIISFHIIEDVCCIAGANAPEEYKTSDFKAISDFLKSKQDAGQLEVVTMSNYFGTSSAPLPPTTTYMPPTPVNTTAAGSKNLSWSAGSGNRTNYFNTSVNGVWSNGTLVGFYNATGKSPGIYTVKVFAVNSTNGITINQAPLTLSTRIDSPAPASLTFVPPIPSISNVTGSNWIRFNWAAGINGNKTDTFNLLVNGATIMSGTAATSYNLTSAVAGTNYFAQVYAFNGTTMNQTPAQLNTSIPVSTPPTPTPAGTPKTVTINVKEDTYTSTSALTRNYGTASYLYGVSGKKIYMKFDPTVIPQNATVLSANMTISISYSEGIGALDVYPVTSAWAEKTLTGSTVVTKGNNFTKMVYPACSNDCWHTDVGFESVVQGWINHSIANNGIVAFASSGKIVEYNARETGYIAYLTVKYV